MKNLIIFFISHFISAFYDDNSLLITYNSSDSTDSSRPPPYLIGINHNILNNLNTTNVSSTNDLGWIWVFIESQYNEAYTPLFLKVHCVFRDQYLKFETNLSEINMKYTIPEYSTAYFQFGYSVYCLSEVLKCQCRLGNIRFYNSLFPTENFDLRSLLHLAGTESGFFNMKFRKNLIFYI